MSTVNAVVLAHSADEFIAEHPVEPGRVRPHRIFDGAGVKIRSLAFDTGVVMKEHRSPFPILVQVLSGRILFRVDGEEHDLRTGGAIHVNGDIPHELEATEPPHVLLSLLE